MDTDTETLAHQAMDARWTPRQQHLLSHLAKALPAARPHPVNVKVWESESYITHAGPQGRALNVAFDHPHEPLWHVELLVDHEDRFQVWLLSNDNTHLDAIPEPERFVDDLLSGSLAFTVKHYAGRVSRIEANRQDISTSFLVPPSNVTVRTRISRRRQSSVLRWTERQRG